MSEYGLRPGSADVQYAGPITFGPAGILFLADNGSARVLAVDVADPGRAPDPEPFDLADVDARIGSYLGCAASDVDIRDMAVHPVSHNVYLSVQRGRGEAGQAVLVRIGVPDGTVTDMAYVDGDPGALLVAGLSNEEFSSRLRRIPFPFGDDVTGNSLEIFHVSHGKWETAAPIRTFVPYDHGASILASYTCTPVVHFPLAGLAPGSKVVGRTVAELGSMNQPLDMVSFADEGEEYLLVANSSHGLIKIACRDIDGQAALTTPREPVGVPRETKDLQGITRLANLNGGYVLALQVDGDGRRHLRSLKSASL